MFRMIVSSDFALVSSSQSCRHEARFGAEVIRAAGNPRPNVSAATTADRLALGQFC